MGRKAHSDYVGAAVAVLTELGGGPISTKVLVAAAQERGLIGQGKWVYHNFSRKVRECPLFDTSVRGEVGLRVGVADPGPVVEALESAEEETETQVFPGPTLGNASFGS